MKLNLLVCTVLLTQGLYAFAEDNHSTMMMQHQHAMKTTDAGLSEAGNDAFGTIQEVISKLNSDPDTDWSKVNLEALRLHLVDMHEMTLNVNLLSQTAVNNGVETVIEPSTPRAAEALVRVFSAHPMQLKQETGWEMQVVKTGERYTLTTTTENPEEISKIRGLGYIGLMAYGAHHQAHHWAMARGENPHEHHH